MDAKKLVARIKDEKKTAKVMLNVRVEKPLRDALMAFSKDNGITATDVVEALLRDLLAATKAKK